GKGCLRVQPTGGPCRRERSVIAGVDWSLLFEIVAALAAAASVIVLATTASKTREFETIRSDQAHFDDNLAAPIRSVLRDYAEHILESELRIAQQTNDSRDAIQRLSKAHYRLATKVHIVARAYGHLPITGHLVRNLEAIHDRAIEKLSKCTTPACLDAAF